MAGVMGGFPATTCDFFPYTGLHRPMVLYSVPAEHIDDVTVVTTIDGKDGVVNVKVVTAGEYAGTEKARLNYIEADSQLWRQFVDRVFSRSWHGLGNTIQLKVLFSTLLHAGVVSA